MYLLLRESWIASENLLVYAPYSMQYTFIRCNINILHILCIIRRVVLLLRICSLAETRVPCDAIRKWNSVWSVLSERTMTVVDAFPTWRWAMAWCGAIVIVAVPLSEILLHSSTPSSKCARCAARRRPSSCFRENSERRALINVASVSLPPYSSWPLFLLHY